MSKYLLNIKPTNLNLTNCFIPICTENAFATYLDYIDVEYHYAFANATIFDFSKDFCDTGRIADGIFTGYDFMKQLKDTYDISVYKKSFGFFKSYIKYIENDLANNKPIIAHFDSYYIPWSTLYQERHTSHLIVITGLDTDAKTITILDPIDKPEPVEITYKEFKLGSHYCLDIIPPTPVKHISHAEFIKDIIQKPDTLIPSHIFDNLSELGDMFTSEFNPDVEFRDCFNRQLMVEEKLVDDIRKLMQGINMFTVWLTWLNGKLNNCDLDEHIEDFKSILSKWNIFINMLYKRCMTTWEMDFGKKASTFIKDISLMHKQSYERLLDCLACETSSTSHNISTNFTMSIPIDLTPYCNNKGFAQGDLITIPCDLTGAGEYYKIDSCYNLSELTIDKMKYYINLANKYDNIICNNDTITIEPPVNAVGLSILCCSEWGKANDIIRINFADNSSKRFSIYANDLPEYDLENSCLTGQTFDVNGTLIQEKAALTKSIFFFNKNKISSIQLPICPNMHIVAMTILVD